MITAPCSWVLAHYGRYGTAADTMIRYRDTIWVISSPVCGILICVKWREEGVAASVQLRPPSESAWPSDLRRSCQSSLAVELLQVLPAHRIIREYQYSSRRIAGTMPACPPWKPRLPIEAVHPSGYGHGMRQACFDPNNIQYLEIKGLSKADLLEISLLVPSTVPA